MNRGTDRDAQYTGVRDAVARILQAEGFRGFFKGMQIKMVQTVCRDGSRVCVGWDGLA